MIEHEEEFGIFSANVIRAARAFYYNVALKEFVKQDPYNACILNDTSWFWDDFRRHNTMAVFIFLGRIFDKPKRARNVHKFLNGIFGTDYFSFENLKERNED